MVLLFFYIVFNILADLDHFLLIIAWVKVFKLFGLAVCKILNYGENLHAFCHLQNFIEMPFSKKYLNNIIG